METLRQFLRQSIERGKVIYPKGREYFAALNCVPFDEVKVVLIGQDPYHGPEQAHGLSFSVRPGIPKPPSLVNILKELKSDLGRQPALPDGNLTPWARQGVLLLNAVLTVEQGSPGSHRDKGWEQFTDKIIEILSRDRDHLVFILWGSYAQKKGLRIDRSKHLVLESVHPSPLSAHRGFFGSRPFSKANDYLHSHHQGQTIDWLLTSPFQEGSRT